MENNVIKGFFQVGYLIKLGEGQYFRQFIKGRIQCGKEWEAHFFGSFKEAERYASKNLWYAGMDPKICRRAWAIVSADCEEGKEEFWDGNVFTSDSRRAKLFHNPKEMRNYIKRHGMSQKAYDDLLVVEEKQIRNAA
ncbi:hypothetical protein H6B07_14800 [Mediterraneibacter glycyrrhizinilyticus]|nr:hypothetical protein [Mediterraneibacter glycyrrhizinilyticus]MBM6803903.1 hypothetical protein [Mediterraneibacter glycyrrhizinilyticus]